MKKSDNKGYCAVKLAIHKASLLLKARFFFIEIDKNLTSDFWASSLNALIAVGSYARLSMQGVCSTSSCESVRYTRRSTRT